MAYHVRICEVYDDNIIFSGADRVCQLLTNGRCAHLRLKVIGCDLRGLHKDTVLTRIRLLNAAVEEEGNVGIFLCPSNSRLSLPVGSKELTESILDRLFLECDKFVRDRLIVINKAYIGGLDPLRSANPVNSSSQNARVISLARSGRKLKKITESLSLMVPIAFPSSPVTTAGTTNSSVFPSSLGRLNPVPSRMFPYCPSPAVSALYASSTRSQRLSRVHRIVTSHNRCHLADTELFIFPLTPATKSFPMPVECHGRLRSSERIILVETVSLCEL